MPVAVLGLCVVVDEVPAVDVVDAAVAVVVEAVGLRPPPDSPGLVHRLGARSGWVASIPVSTTPTVTCAEPVVTSHASGARMAVMSHS